MPALRLGPRDLLEYDARYGVLICRECQYAIQKNALQSHLLRHKIYRDGRQRLMSFIAQLDLFELDDVPLPPPNSPPIDALPIISGYRCTAVGCGKLCASSKRMRRHRSEIHGLFEPTNSCSFARPVKLQTFFRGTKLRYFEVTPSPTAGTARVVPLATAIDNDDQDEDDEDDNGEYDDVGHGEQLHADRATPVPSQPPTRVPWTPPESVPAKLDLETLTYFHHFTATTSLTLPDFEHPRPETRYWQKNIVLQALQQRWLMCGLLAISACHLAALADDIRTERIHRERSTEFFSAFSSGWDEAIKRDLGGVHAGLEEEGMKAGGKIRYILRCAHWALAGSTLDQGIFLEPGVPPQAQSIMTTVWGFVTPDFALHSGGIRGANSQEEMFAEARKTLNTESLITLSSCNHTPSALLNHLRTLPSRMAETFGRPDSVQDVLATLSAISALAECCDTSFASDEVGAAWRSMVSWLTKVPERFNTLVSHHSPAALVVLAHWAASLVKRAELCGCWFLRGSATAILLQLADRLPADDPGVQSLVGSLMA